MTSNNMTYGDHTYHVTSLHGQYMTCGGHTYHVTSVYTRCVLTIPSNYIPCHINTWSGSGVAIYTMLYQSGHSIGNRFYTLAPSKNHATRSTDAVWQRMQQDFVSCRQQMKLIWLFICSTR